MGCAGSSREGDHHPQSDAQRHLHDALEARLWDILRAPAAPLPNATAAAAEKPQLAAAQHAPPTLRRKKTTTFSQLLINASEASVSEKYYAQGVLPSPPYFELDDFGTSAPEQYKPREHPAMRTRKRNPPRHTPHNASPLTFWNDEGAAAARGGDAHRHQRDALDTHPWNNLCAPDVDAQREAPGVAEGTHEHADNLHAYADPEVLRCHVNLPEATQSTGPERRCPAAYFAPPGLRRRGEHTTEVTHVRGAGGQAFAEYFAPPGLKRRVVDVPKVPRPTEAEGCGNHACLPEAEGYGADGYFKPPGLERPRYAAHDRAGRQFPPPGLERRCFANSEIKHPPQTEGYVAGVGYEPHELEFQADQPKYSHYGARAPVGRNDAAVDSMMGAYEYGRKDGRLRQRR